MVSNLLGTMPQTEPRPGFMRCKSGKARGELLGKSGSADRVAGLPALDRCTSVSGPRPVGIVSWGLLGASSGHAPKIKIVVKGHEQNRTPFGTPEMSGAVQTLGLGFRTIRKMATIHVSSGVIWKDVAVTTSKKIAGLIGPTLVSIAAAMLLNFSSLPAVAEQVSRYPALIFVSGILLFVAGLAIVRAHNIWVGGWPVLVIALGRVPFFGGRASGQIR
jgi:hypothetical protein